jgi:hypothetical protein
MVQSVISAGLLVLWVVLIPVGIAARDFYVSPNGTPSGPGTMAQPYDLATTLLGARPGYTIWLLGGTYRMGHVDTKIAGEPGAPITFRPMPGEKARVDGSITFFDSVGYVILRDFELFSSDTNRASSQTGVGFNVTDIQIIPGIASFAPNLSFINLIVHDHTRHGFYTSRISTNNLIYGCVVYNNGWVSPDNAEGHGIYAQGAIGTQEIADNIVFQSSGANMHIYENGSGQRLTGITLDGNVAFNAGAIQDVRVYRDWIVGVDEPAASADDIILKNNMGCLSPLQAEIGRQGINGRVALWNNYFPQGLVLNNWGTAEVTSNVFSAATRNAIVALDQTQASSSATWDSNAYVHPGDGSNFVINANAYSFSEWQSTTGYDQNSTYQTSSLSGTQVFIRTNRYEAGRANIVVYNWNNLNSVAVDVRAVVTPGAAYEVRNAQDFLGPPLASGVFNGQLLELPMTGLTVAAPNGPLLAPPPTGPTFNVFVLLPRSVRLQIAAVDGQAQISWPTNAGTWVLQFCDNLSPYGGWTDSVGTAAVRGEQYVVTTSFAQGTRFYRLRAAP